MRELSGREVYGAEEWEERWSGNRQSWEARAVSRGRKPYPFPPGSSAPLL
jgi:hypothetical protein